VKRQHPITVGRSQVLLVHLSLDSGQMTQVVASEPSLLSWPFSLY